MLLPNLEYNPDFEGGPEANLLSLEDEVTAEDNPATEKLLTLAQTPNWIHPRSDWIRKSHRDQRIREQLPDRSEGSS